MAAVVPTPAPVAATAPVPLPAAAGESAASIATALLEPPPTTLFDACKEVLRGLSRREAATTVTPLETATRPDSRDATKPVPGRKLDGLAIRILHLLSVQRQGAGDDDLRQSASSSAAGTERPRAAELDDASGSRTQIESDEALPEWRQTWIPLPLDAGSPRLHLQWCDEGGGESAEGGLRQRFVLTVQLSRLGPLQLDGLVDRGQLRFDLMLRSENALPVVVRKDVQHLFDDALAILNVRGRVGFGTAEGFRSAATAHTPTFGAGIVV